MANIKYLPINFTIQTFTRFQAVDIKSRILESDRENAAQVFLDGYFHFQSFNFTSYQE